MRTLACGDGPVDSRHFGVVDFLRLLVPEEKQRATPRLGEEMTICGSERGRTGEEDGSRRKQEKQEVWSRRKPELEALLPGGRLC